MKRYWGYLGGIAARVWRRISHWKWSVVGGDGHFLGGLFADRAGGVFERVQRDGASIRALVRWDYWGMAWISCDERRAILGFGLSAVFGKSWRCFWWMALRYRRAVRRYAVECVRIFEEKH